MGALFVAAGGGGDAITAAVLAPILSTSDQPPVIMTYSWDRLLIDPLPGPRVASDFTGLRRLGPHVLEILPTSAPIPPAGSTLPRLAADLPARLLLLDPTAGAAGMAAQVNAAADLFGVAQITLVDVGGDALTTGSEPGLRSPLADLLALAACTRTERPAQLMVPAPGVDGELSESAVMARLEELGAEHLALLTGDPFQPVQHIFAWHPSEASGLLAAAASGIRGSVEVRDAGCQIHLTDTTPIVFAVDAHKVAASSPAAALCATTTLGESQEIVRQLTGISEIDYETTKAARLRDPRPHLPTRADLPAIDRYAADAAGRCANYVTVRRMAELLGVTSRDGFAKFRELLVDARPEQYKPPLYHVAP
ncbi:MAG: DUF1152 domain-containing protein [Gammaproteobacteria bacterium]